MVQTELTALVERARRGDRQAQETLLAEVQNRVYYHCRKMMKNDSDAQDATQDVLITVLTSLDKLREPAAFYGWVNGITANRCKHLLTQGTHEWQIPETEDGDSMLDSLEDLDKQAVPDAVLDDKETQRLMMEIIDTLPPEQRMSVLFYYYDEMSVKEIAQAMAVSEGTVKSRLNYARKSIKTGVEGLEKRGVKLYSIAPLPLLLLLFLRRDAAQSGMTAAQSAQVSAAVLSAVRPGAAGAGAAASTAGGAAAKTGTAIGAKIAAGVAAAVAVVGVVLGVTMLNRPDELPPAEDGSAASVVQPLETPEPPEDDGPSPELLALLDGIVYYGDKEQCRLTGEQAAAFAAVLRQETENLNADVKWGTFGQGAETGAYAALFDVGDGTPALFFGGGATYDFSAPYLDENAVYWSDVGTVGIWEYRDGQAVPYAPEGQEPGGYWGQILSLREGSLFIGGPRGSDGSKYDGGVYPLTGGVIPTAPQTSAGYEPKDLADPYDPRYTVDGAEATQEEFEAWRNRWERQTTLCDHRWDGGVGGSFTGLGDAAAAAEALTQYAVAMAVSIPDTSGASASRPYAYAYAQKVRELMVYDPNMTFALVYIDGDDIPELLADRSDVDIQRISLYTFGGDSLYPLVEELAVGIRDYLGCCPGENLVEFSGAELSMNQWESSGTFYQINAAHQWEQVSDPGGGSAEMQALRGSMTGEEILAQLDE